MPKKLNPTPANTKPLLWKKIKLFHSVLVDMSDHNPPPNIRNLVSRNATRSTPGLFARIVVFIWAFFVGVRHHSNIGPFSTLNHCYHDI
jgi:hypothetical protein